MSKRKSWDKMTKAEKKQLRWEEQNLVYGKGYLDKSTSHHKSIESNMATRGYSAMRISPSRTNKFGNSYRAIYGAEVEPDYRQRPTKNGKYPAKVTWHKQGYIKDRGNLKTGTRTLDDLRNYPVDMKSAKYKLMIKDRRKKSKSRKPKKKKKSKYYVTMTDQFMSGWGKARGKTNKFIVECDNYDQARRVERNAKQRDEMKYVNIRSTKPNYNERHIKPSWKKYKDLGHIWKK